MWTKKFFFFVDTPIDLAKDNGHHHVVGFLKSYKKPTNKK